MVRNDWDLEQHARHLRREALAASTRHRLLAEAGRPAGKRSIVPARAAESVANWLETAADRVRRSAARPTATPTIADGRQGC